MSDSLMDSVSSNSEQSLPVAANPILPTTAWVVARDVMRSADLCICDSSDGMRLVSEIDPRTPLDVARLFAASPHLLRSLSALLAFAETYGPSERSGNVDWAGYFDDAREALELAGYPS